MLAVAAAAPAFAGQSDFWFTDEMAPYRELVGAYRDGDAGTALAGVRAMAPSAVHDILDRVREPDTRLTGTDADPALNERLFRAAAMLHLDVAELLRSRGLHGDAEDQIEIAIRWVNLGERDPEPIGSFRRRWFLGAAFLAFEHGGWQDGVTFTDLACGLLPDDVALLTARGLVQRGSGPGPGGPRRAGAGGIAAGAGTEAQPVAGRGPAGRRGAPDRPDRARGDPAAGAGPDAAGPGGVGARGVDASRGPRRSSPGVCLSGGRLLLGRLHLQAGEPAEAERRFRDAIDLDPQGQAARVALGRLLEGRGDRRGAVAVLDPILRGESGAAIDPWVDYLLGAGAGPDRRDALRRELRR